MFDDVNGIVIGEVTSDIYVAFFENGQQLTTGQWFKDEQSAVDWFKHHWPEAFSRGVEMRIFE